MKLYSEVILPRLCHVLMRQAFLAPYRRELLSAARGEILEIGFGTGLNLPFYPPQVGRIAAVDPNAGMWRQARKEIGRSAIKVEQHVADCARLPFADDRFDCVVSTWTLCSIDDVQQALHEIERVMRPGGRFLF